MSQRKFWEIPVTTLASGYRLALPVHEIRGAQPGPTLGMTALIHGDELLPNVIFRRIWQEIDPRRLRGRLLLMPVANPLALESYMRNTPLDMGNLNRLYPGAPDGLVTELWADAVMSSFVPEIDYLIDWHAGGTFPIVDYVFKSPGAPDLAHAFGLSVIYDGPVFEGALARLAEEQGVPTVIVEIGGGALMDAQYLTLGVRGAYNVMKALNMMDGDPKVPQNQVVVSELKTIRPRTGGVLLPELTPEQMGQILSGGTVLGRVISPYTFEELEVMRAPFAKSLIVLLRVTPTRVNPGDYAFMAANAATILDPS
jgi:predicted deacylase